MRIGVYGNIANFNPYGSMAQMILNGVNEDSQTRIEKLKEKDLDKSESDKKG